MFKSSIKVVFLSVKLHSGAFEEHRYHFLISIINYYFKPVKNICQRVLDSGNAYFKHRTRVGNCFSVFPLMKEAYNGQYTEFDFSANLALRPKDEVQSAHFIGKTVYFPLFDSPVGS